MKHFILLILLLPFLAIAQTTTKPHTTVVKKKVIPAKLLDGFVINGNSGDALARMGSLYHAQVKTTQVIAQAGKKANATGPVKKEAKKLLMEAQAAADKDKEK